MRKYSLSATVFVIALGVSVGLMLLRLESNPKISKYEALKQTLEAPILEPAPIVSGMDQVVGSPRSLDECGDASVLFMKDSGARTKLQNDKIILYFNFDSQAYEINVSDAVWVIDGQRQPVNLLNEGEKHALSTGDVDYVCYYSRAAVTDDWFVDHNVFSVQFKLNAPVLLFPTS